MSIQEYMSSNGLFLRCVGDSQKPALVLLHGWAMTGAVFEPLFDRLSETYFLIVPDLPNHGRSHVSVHQPDMDEVLAHLKTAIHPFIRQPALVAGWSLGGNVALNWAHQEPLRFKGVLSIASNPQFVADQVHPFGMDEATFQAFQHGVSTDAKKTLSRFALLQVQGSSEAKTQLKTVKTAISDIDSAERQTGLLVMLNLLTHSSWALLPDMSQPVVHLLGELDALVPSSIAEGLSLKTHRVEVIEGAGHLPFLSSSDAMLDLLSWLSNQSTLDAQSSNVIEKARVAASFGKASSTYDSVAGLQREIGQALLSLLPKEVSPKRICDLGSGTGFFTEQLADRWPDQECIGLDLSHGMLTHAKANRDRSNIAWVCGDAESLPLRDNQVDLLFTSLAIQWCASIEQVMAEIARVLSPGGVALVATLGPKTLCELKSAWSEVDGYVHVNQFIDHERHQASIASAGLIARHESVERKVLTFDSVSDLTHELKALGAHNMSAHQGQGLTGRERIKRFKAAYEGHRTADGQIPATYEVYYWCLQKPE